MTPLMVLALTLPPSLAFVIERWMAGREAQARKLAAEQVGRIDALHADAIAALTDLAEMYEKQSAHSAELKRLNEQLTILADRR